MDDPIVFALAFSGTFIPFFFGLWGVIHKLHKDTDGKIKKLNDGVGKEVSTLKNDMKALNKEFDTLIEMVGKDISKLKTATKGVNEEASKLKTAVKNVSEETSKLKTAVQDVGEETPKLKKRLSEVENFIRGLEGVLAQFKNKNDERD